MSWTRNAEAVVRRSLWSFIEVRKDVGLVCVRVRLFGAHTEEMFGSDIESLLCVIWLGSE